MKFLADAHISVEMVAMLRDRGHECLDSSAIPPPMPPSLYSPNHQSYSPARVAGDGCANRDGEGAGAGEG
jgi:hypothetical protein